MNIWEKARKYQGSTKDNPGRYSYGENEFKNFLSHSKLFFGYWKDLSTSLQRCPFIPFLTKDSHTYKKYQKLGYEGTKTEYNKDSDEILQLTSNFNFNFFNLRNNNIFKLNEFGHLSILIKDIYIHGSFNWPCFRLHPTGHLCAHPGKHLWFAKRFLGLTDSGFVAFRKTKKHEKKIIMDNFIKLKNISSTDDIISIYRHDNIVAKIQNYTHQQVPSFEAKINHGSWKDYDKNGHLCWPTIEAEEFMFELPNLKWINFFQDICDLKNPKSEINKYIEVKTGFSSIDLLKNNLYAFLLSGRDWDTKFKKIRNFG